MRQIDDGGHIKFDINAAVSFHFLLNLSKIYTTIWQLLFFIGFGRHEGFNNPNRFNTVII